MTTETTIAQFQAAAIQQGPAVTAVNDALSQVAQQITVSAEAITSTITNVPAVGSPGFTTDDAHRIAHVVYRTLRNFVTAVVDINNGIADSTS